MDTTNRTPLVVCVQGLGFVGSAMAVAAASAVDANGIPYYDVYGVDLPTEQGSKRAAKINSGQFPFPSTDRLLCERLKEAVKRGNLKAGTDDSVYESADVVIMNVELDLDTERRSVSYSGITRAAETLGKRLPKGALVIVETTVPPGTTQRLVVPTIDTALEKRGLEAGDVLVAHSYERVMPGEDYLNSIINFWRVYSGVTDEAADACRDFFAKIINTDDYPMSRLHSTTASELAKVLENTFRATNISLISEWATFAEKSGVDLYQVVEAIRVRPTHKNIMLPGLGVGGYCLTKDPLFPQICSSALLDIDPQHFPVSAMAVDINRAMPGNSLLRLKDMLGGALDGKRILIAGASYRPGVGDTRCSPSLDFARLLEAEGAVPELHDPLVTPVDAPGFTLHDRLPDITCYDALVLAVPHAHYGTPDFLSWLDKTTGVVLDTCGMLSAPTRTALRNNNIRVETTGRGDGL